MDAKLGEQGIENGIRSIVVVEGEQDVADSIRYSLKHEGFRVWVATTGPAALDHILDHPPNPSRQPQDRHTRRCASRAKPAAQIEAASDRNDHGHRLSACGFTFVEADALAEAPLVGYCFWLFLNAYLKQDQRRYHGR